jgi:hypothetical protein
MSDTAWVAREADLLIDIMIIFPAQLKWRLRSIMAIDPSRVVQDGPRFFENKPSKLLQLKDPRAYLIQSASRLIRECPPVLPWASPFRNEVFRGLFRGPTSTAYFFWTLSTKHADLEIEGKLPADWCKAYLELGQDDLPLGFDISCGITNEFLTSNALRACLYKDDTYALKVLAALESLETDPTYCEWLKGRAGALYILRMLRRWLPHLSASINRVIVLLIQDMLPQQPWVWNNHQYIGTVHGEVGILTQIVLSDASFAPRLENKLLSLLRLQNADGNWPVVEGRDEGLVQFCHGAPGVVLSLLALKTYFPMLSTEIDTAIELGRKLIWEKGLLTKEPNICHGILGNALALDGNRRDHFLCLATPDLVQDGLADGRFEKSWESFGMAWGEAGRAWIWLDIWDGPRGTVAMYTDV